VAIHSSGQTVSSFSHIEGITLSADEKVDEVAGGASGMGVDRIVKVDDWVSEVLLRYMGQVLQWNL
jgi:hypothetical protein